MSQLRIGPIGPYSAISTFGNEHFNHNQFVKKVIFTNVVFRIFEHLVRKVNKLKNLIVKTLIALGYLRRQ